MKSRIVKDFLTLRLKKGAKLLLGFSGGPDSMALLHFLLEAKEDFDFSLHLAHIDHGWRKESGEEAKALERVAKHLNLPFHLCRLQKMEGGDLENRAREKRLAFFSELQEKYGFQALLLAHHQGDQAETVFKRIAEGSGIKGLGGLYPERKQGNLLIWRPLLPLLKEDLYHYLKTKHLTFFEDSTNQDPTYLRSRMREELFPALEKIFGKKMEGNFARLGKTYQELANYFEEKGEAIKKSITSGPFGSYLDLNLEFHPLELKFFLKEMSSISYDALEVLMKLIEGRRSSRLIHAKPYTFQLSQSHLFIYKEPFPDYFRKPEIWKSEKNGNWKTFWNGKIQVPKGDYEIKRLSELEPLIRRKIKKWYGSSRVPSFFYDKAPIFMRNQEIIGECLTGRSLLLEGYDGLFRN
ncbi:MAG: tRNA lysidine(34) synthetase TilS [Chlamydiales bacterium]|nr:tRNA lysidine(34) synthetase TilS [Chlamydiia bacterium]MCP5504854.1 tRNA lysidine(34) synthetase TilS [Chlamydiales bacterium]